MRRLFHHLLLAPLALLPTGAGAQDHDPDDLDTFSILLGARAEALAALGEAVALNPWNRTQLPRNANVESLRTDPAFLRITGG